MNTICVLNEFYGRKSYRWMPSTALVYINEEKELRSASDAKIGDKLIDCNRAIVLGICVEKIKNDPDADVFAMDSVEMIEEIRKLRKIIREK